MKNVELLNCVSCVLRFMGCSFILTSQRGLSSCPLGGSIAPAAALEPQQESPSASRRKTQPISDTKYFI